MKILFLAHNGHPYGANKSMYSVMKYLKKDNDILLFTPFKNQFLDNSDIKNYNIPYFPTIFFYKRRLKYLVYPFLMCLNILMFPYLLYRMWQFKPDVIYSNSSVENVGYFLSLFSKAKHITHVREFGDLDYNFICILGKKFKRYILNTCDGLIFNSNTVREYVMSRQEEHTLCETIYNGINGDKYSYHMKNFSEKKDFRVGLVGFIHPEKGQFGALQYMTPILQENNDISLHIFGTGDSKSLNEINNHIKSNNLTEKVFLEGFVKNTDAIYEKLDVSLVFSKNEAFGRVTIESMLRGVPVIAFNGGGTTEIIEHMKDGLLFETSSEFEIYFDKLYHDPELYRTIHRAGVLKIKESFSEERYTCEVEQFINKVYENRNN